MGLLLFEKHSTEVHRLPVRRVGVDPEGETARLIDGELKQGCDCPRYVTSILFRLPANDSMRIRSESDAASQAE